MRVVQWCLLALLSAGVFSSEVLADVEAPSLPDSLSSARYSSTAGEIFWGPATDNDFVVGYHVVRNGESLGIKDARSLYEASLLPGQASVYQVSAVDRAGNEGPALQVELADRSGVGREGSPVTTTGGGSGPEPTTGGQSGGTSDDGGLQLTLNRSRVSLLEGDADEVSIDITLDRLKSEKRQVSLSLEASHKDSLGLHHRFSRAELSSGQDRSVVRLQLDVTAAPLMSHERHVQIVADDGESVARTSLTIEVTPTAAPDVYLLIGQSNMEGYSEVGSRESYPGGKDERHERIQQLNVQPNNRQLFASKSSFSNEDTNVHTPLFVPAEDPLHEPRYMEVDGKGATFVGLGLTFAKETLGLTTADVYLVPAAWGATGFCANNNGDLAWNASANNSSFLGGNLLTNRALTRLNMTLRESGGVLRGILWHQGGADSNNPDCARTYATNLKKLVRRLRGEARQDLRGSAARGNEAQIPLIVGTQSKGDDARGRFSIFNSSKLQVDSAQRLVSDYIPYSTFVNNDDLVPPHYPCGQSSCVHFGAAALREQGRRFQAALRQLWGTMDTYHY